MSREMSSENSWRHRWMIIMSWGKRVRYSNVNVWKCPEVNVITLRHAGFCVSKRWALLFLLSLDWLIKDDWRNEWRRTSLHHICFCQPKAFAIIWILFKSCHFLDTMPNHNKHISNRAGLDLSYSHSLLLITKNTENSYHEQSLGHSGREIIWMRGRQLEQSSDK